jgi:6-methylsalicylate decarboxylase
LSDLKFIFCHGGGVMPILLGRIAGFSGWATVGAARLGRGCTSDCAQAYAPETIEMLLKIVPPSHLLFGSDYSYFPISHSVEQFATARLPDDIRTMVPLADRPKAMPRPAW